MISIVDDDAIVRDATLNLVRSLGFTGATFASAEEFLESDRVNNTACLIADVQLPGLSGIELQTRLRTQGNPTPVIFITGFPEARIRAQALDAGAIGFLSKPYDAETLIDCLDKALCPDCARTLNECPPDGSR
jgi:FixJ family two-component response regulator